MAMGFQSLELLASSVRHAFPEDRKQPLKAVGLGYLDIVVPIDGLNSQYKNLAPAEIQPVSKRYDLVKSFGYSENEFTALDTYFVFQALGLDTVFIDIRQHRGMELIVDLNEPIPAELEKSFDVVIDPGTLEHCFNLGQAFKNVNAMTRLGGVMMLGAPMNQFNHGFWNFSPTAYADYFSSNGCKIIYFRGWTGNLRDGFTEFDVPAYKSFKNIPDTSTLVCVAVKEEDKPHVWPTQTKFNRYI